MKAYLLRAQDVDRILQLGVGTHLVELPCSLATVKVLDKEVEIEGEAIPISELRRIRRSNIFYIPMHGQLVQARIFTNHHYKLAPTGGFPALEIDGVRMHRSKDMSPEEEARLKVDRLEVEPGLRVLDICTGLGYCAQELAGRGCTVVSLEKKAEVIELARLNPCSQPFFEYLEEGRVRLVLSDATRLVPVLPDRYFDRIIHDPPTFSMAGELYSLSFYNHLHTILKPGGILLHYTGQPGSKYRQLSLKRGVSERLRRAGFHTEWDSMTRSVVAQPVETEQLEDKRRSKRDHKG